MNGILWLWLLAILALAVGTAQIYLALIEAVPIRWLYWHTHLRKPLLWGILVIGGVIAWRVVAAEHALGAVIVPVCLQALALVLTYRLHQETVFDAVSFPAFVTDPALSPLPDDADVALLAADNELRAYPLAYVEHHHVVNDRLGDRLIALTFCAMCRTIIAFDVTELGPLYVGSFKNANLILADRKTRTFFQQATFESMIGPLHPRTLDFYPSQILPWGEAKQLQPTPSVVKVNEHDLRGFSLPIPGVWQRILHSELTPGLSAAARDKRLPARTRVIGVFAHGREWAYIKTDVLAQDQVTNAEGGFVLIPTGDTVSAYAAVVDGHALALCSTDGNRLRDTASDTVWDRRGKYVAGPLHRDLPLLRTSDEFWFSWAKFHPRSMLIRLASARGA